MSTHTLPAGLDMDRARALLLRHLRLPSGVVYGAGDNAPPTALEFTPDLDAVELVTLARILATAARTLDLSPAEEAAIQAETATLRAYLQAAAPTNAQTVTALKALVRVVRAIVRD